MSETMKCTAYRPIDKGMVQGAADLFVPALGATLVDCLVFKGQNGRWVNPPNRPMIDRDGKQIRNGDGKPGYKDILKFAGRADKDAWSHAALAAIDAFTGAKRGSAATDDPNDEVPF